MFQCLPGPGEVLINLFESEIDFELRTFFSHYLSNAYNIWLKCMIKLQIGLINLELEHELDLRLKKFYKHCPW